MYTLHKYNVLFLKFTTNRKCLDIQGYTFEIYASKKCQYSRQPLFNVFELSVPCKMEINEIQTCSHECQVCYVGFTEVICVIHTF